MAPAHTLVSGKNAADLLLLFDRKGAHERRFLTRSCCYWYVAVTNNSQNGFPRIEDLQHRVLAHKRVQEAVDHTVTERRIPHSDSANFMDRGRAFKKAETVAKEMIGSVTSNVIKFCGWIYLTLLKQVCGSVQFSPKQMTMIGDLSRQSCPIVYMPLHYSHLDYILLSLVLFHNNVKVPYIASGNNLHLPIIGYFIKRAGGFFIRRKLDENNKKDLIYRAVLHTYITELLKDGQSIEVFIEGTRSRSGLPNMPKTGILSVFVDAVVEKEIDDVMIVPVHTSYERLLEGNFNNELMGQSKKPECLFDTLKSFVRLLFGHYGNIKINFAKPISLKSALTDICEYSSKSSSVSYLQAVDAPSNRQSSSPELEVSWRKNISSLAEHIIYRGMCGGSFMSTHLIAFLLVNQFRDGVYLEDLVEAYCRLKSELTNRGRDCAFCGVPQAVVLRALELFCDSLVTIHYLNGEKGEDSFPEPPNDDNTQDAVLCLSGEGDADNADSGIFVNCNIETASTGSPARHKNAMPMESSTLFIKPSTDIPSIFELSYYSNALTPVFAIESIICLSVTAVTGFKFSMIDKLWSINGSAEIFEDELPEKMKRTFSRSTVIQKSMELCDFLQLDLILCDVIANLEECIQEKLQDLISSGYIISSTIGSSKQVPYSYGIDDEDIMVEQEFLKVNPHSIPQLLCNQSVLSPFVEACTIVTEQLGTLSEPISQKDFLAHIMEHSRMRAKSGLTTRMESCSSEIISHCIRAFVLNGILEMNSGDLCLTDGCREAAYLRSLLSKISSFMM